MNLKLIKSKKIVRSNCFLLRLGVEFNLINLRYDSVRFISLGNIKERKKLDINLNHIIKEIINNKKNKNINERDSEKFFELHQLQLSKILNIIPIITKIDRSIFNIAQTEKKLGYNLFNSIKLIDMIKDKDEQEIANKGENTDESNISDSTGKGIKEVYFTDECENYLEMGDITDFVFSTFWDPREQLNKTSIPYVYRDLERDFKYNAIFCSLTKPIRSINSNRITNKESIVAKILETRDKEMLSILLDLDYRIELFYRISKYINESYEKKHIYKQTDNIRNIINTNKQILVVCVVDHLIRQIGVEENELYNGIVSYLPTADYPYKEADREHETINPEYKFIVTIVTYHKYFKQEFFRDYISNNNYLPYNTIHIFLNKN